MRQYFLQESFSPLSGQGPLKPEIFFVWCTECDPAPQGVHRFFRVERNVFLLGFKLAIQKLLEAPNVRERPFGYRRWVFPIPKVLKIPIVVVFGKDVSVDIETKGDINRGNGFGDINGSKSRIKVLAT